ADALAVAIGHLENELIPLRHAGRLEVQASYRQKYMAVASELVAAANKLARLNDEAKAIYERAAAEFTTEERCEGKDVVRPAAGLGVRIWKDAWTTYGNDNHERDAVIG